MKKPEVRNLNTSRSNITKQIERLYNANLISEQASKSHMNILTFYFPFITFSFSLMSKNQGDNSCLVLLGQISSLGRLGRLAGSFRSLDSFDSVSWFVCLQLQFRFDHLVNLFSLLLRSWRYSKFVQIFFLLICSSSLIGSLRFSGSLVLNPWLTISELLVQWLRGSGSLCLNSWFIDVELLLRQFQYKVLAALTPTHAQDING